jgi:hypothetical protein
MLPAPVANNTASPLVLTPPETVFISFIHDIARKALEHNNSIFIGANCAMQHCFQEFARGIKEHKINKTDMHVNELLLSLWNKSKNQVENELRLRGNYEEIKHENKSLLDVERTMFKLDLSNRKGKVFTKRQMECLLRVFEHHQSVLLD